MRKTLPLGIEDGYLEVQVFSSNPKYEGNYGGKAFVRHVNLIYVWQDDVTCDVYKRLKGNLWKCVGVNPNEALFKILVVRQYI